MLRSKAVTTAIQSLAGVSTYQRSAPTFFDLDSAHVRRVREAQGGQLQPLQASQLEWYMSDLATAQRLADGGDMQQIARLARAMRRDGVIRGLLETRTAGLVALPRRFAGDEKIVAELQNTTTVRPLFDEMFPPEELASYSADLIVCGVAVAELLPVVGRDHPMMVRRDPEFLRYRWSEDRWYFNSVAGQIPITPGDGRWMLTTDGRVAPWNSGLWPALGRSYIAKEHALLARANFASALANPARVAFNPPGATEADRRGFLASLIAWGINACFELPQGWDVKLLETNGRGWEVFGAEIETANLEIMIALAGSKVLVDGGTGFANAGIHAGIRADLIKKSGELLAHAVNTQGLPPWVIARFGIGALANTPRVEWDVAPAADRKAEAEGIKTIAEALSLLRGVVGDAIDVKAVLGRYGVTLLPGVEPKPIEPPEPTAAPEQKATPDAE